ncbi:hypothetical protein ISS85_04355 [Candidatus Microgenomates bacterium]|nr:hypothetical protein [Candidatus Microgenomates bacterium]
MSLTNNPPKAKIFRRTGWANGWPLGELKVESEKLKVYIFYWPQVLECVGFLMIGISFVWLVKSKPGRIKGDDSLSNKDKKDIGHKIL